VNLNPFDDISNSFVEDPFPFLYKKVKNGINKKVISFSVYGEKSVYLLGAEKNIEEAKKIYPGWICRFYCDENISNIEKLKSLAQKGECEVIIPQTPIFQMYWRYFAADDPDVSAVIFRDTDSLVNYREQAAVKDWLNSDKIMHTMHDNDAGHWSPVMGGMCGLKLPINFKMFEQIDSWCKNLRNYKFSYSDDQTFLSKKLLTILENSLIDHHNNPPKSKFKNSVAFPSHQPITYGGFVGDRVSAFTLMKEKYINLNSDKVFAVPHLGPDDYFVCKNAIQYLINSNKEIVLPTKPASSNFVNFLFGGNQNVKIEICDSDHSAFNTYEKKYKDSHKLVPLGIHGASIKGMFWSDELCFRQLKIPVDKTLFRLNSSPEFNYTSLPKKYLDLKKVKAEEPVLKISNNNPPLVTAIVATYNRFDSLLKTISSIKSQKYDNIEIIVVNDKSTDERYYSFNWESQKIKIIHLDPSSKEDIGFPVPGGYQRNFGMKAASGDYYAFCDDDDLWLPNKIEDQIKSMQLSECKMSCTDGYKGNGAYSVEKKYPIYNKDVFFNTLKKIYENSRYDFSLYNDNFPSVWDEGFFKKHNCVICSSVVIHKSIFSSVGDFTPMKAADDYEYWKRVIKLTNCYYLNKPLVYYDEGHAGGINYSWS
jgi:GT2 family glycosyltransferase